MSELTTNLQTAPDEPPEFNPMQAEYELQHLHKLRQAGNWSIVAFADESIIDHRFFQFRNDDGDYLGNIRYSDSQKGWLAYNYRDGLINPLAETETGPQPIAYGSMKFAAKRVEKRGEQSPGHAARRLIVARAALLLAALRFGR